MRPSVFKEAAKDIVSGKHIFACSAISARDCSAINPSAAGCNPRSLFCDLFRPYKSYDFNYRGYGFFGFPTKQAQLARSIALLLCAEILKSEKRRNGVTTT